ALRLAALRALVAIGQQPFQHSLLVTAKLALHFHEMLETRIDGLHSRRDSADAIKKLVDAEIGKSAAAAEYQHSENSPEVAWKGARILPEIVRPDDAAEGSGDLAPVQAIVLVRDADP